MGILLGEQMGVYSSPVLLRGISITRNCAYIHVLAGKYPTNMKLHLKKCNPNEYEEVLQLAKEAAEPKVSTKGPVKSN